ncbi:MAG TPA: hypothetical protein ACFYDZ_10460 [Candidatus Brocadiaceae bacterium]
MKKGIMALIFPVALFFIMSFVPSLPAGQGERAGWIKQGESIINPNQPEGSRRLQSAQSAHTNPNSAIQNQQALFCKKNSLAQRCSA